VLLLRSPLENLLRSLSFVNESTCALKALSTDIIYSDTIHLNYKEGYQYKSYSFVGV
jgi:hypothetical protein